MTTFHLIWHHCISTTRNTIHITVPFTWDTMWLTHNTAALALQQNRGNKLILLILFTSLIFRLMERILFSCKGFYRFKKLLHSKHISLMKYLQILRQKYELHFTTKGSESQYSLRDYIRLPVSKWQSWDWNLGLLTPCVGLIHLPHLSFSIFTLNRSFFVVVFIYLNQVSLWWGNTVPITSLSLLVFCNLVVQKKVLLAETSHGGLSGQWSHSDWWVKKKMSFTRLDKLALWLVPNSWHPALVISPGPDLGEADSLCYEQSHTLDLAKYLTSEVWGQWAPLRTMTPHYFPAPLPKNSRTALRSYCPILFLFPLCFSFW